MESRPLKQLIALVLDTKGMEGPVTRRELADEVMKLAASDQWSASDQYNANRDYIQKGITVQMGEAHSPEFIAVHFSHIPEEHRDTLRKIPLYICISSGGGRGSQHIRTLVATKEHWEANFALKDQIVQATRVSRNRSRDIRDLLEATGAGCLADLLNSEKAA